MSFEICMIKMLMLSEVKADKQKLHLEETTQKVIIAVENRIISLLH